MSERYVYRSEKIDGRVRRVYVGKTDSVPAMLYALERDQQRRLQAEQQAVADMLDLDNVDAVDLRRLETLAIQERGYSLTKSRKWKPKKDNERP